MSRRLLRTLLCLLFGSIFLYAGALKARDPMTFLDCFLSDSGNNRTGWKDARYDRLLQRAAAEGDPDRRRGILREAERLLVEEAVPVTGLYSHVGLYAADPRKVGGIWPNRMDEHPCFSMRRVRP